MSCGDVFPLSVREPIYDQGCKFLNRQEAKQKLSTLAPGTAEYIQLQDALARIEGLVEISLPALTYKVYTSPEEHKLLGGFGSSEHVAIGAAVKLKGLNEDEPLLKVGTTLIKFKHIVALAGDFYAVPGQAISLPGGTDEEKTNRFQNAFNTLYQADAIQIKKVIEEIALECEAVHHAALPHHCYSNQMVEKNRAIKQLKPDIDDLLIDNSDHFSVNAEDAYRIGHTLALKRAAQAKNIEELKYAYAIDAFACHFLTDLFAAGHIRNQRGPLEIFLKTLGFGSVPVLSDIPGLRKLQSPKSLAGILTGAQHEQDGNSGLNVRNGRGEWRAYGDGCFFQPPNKENKERVIEAVQRSADEIYEAYQKKNLPSFSSESVYQLIPHVTEFNPVPLYEVDLKQQKLNLYRGSKVIQIRTAQAFLKDGLAQALKYLPKGYIDGFVNDACKISPLHPLVSSVSWQGGRLTAVVWQVLGLPSYNQVSKECQKLNEKMDEMALILKATYELNMAICERLKEIENMLHEQALFQDIRDPISQIKKIENEYYHYKSALNDKQIELAEIQLWDAHIKLSSVFINGTVEGKTLLISYKEMLGKITKIEPFEAKIAVTRWFRQMIDYQIKAFNLYAIFSTMGNRNKTAAIQKERKQLLLKQTQIFGSSIVDQVKANKAHIVESLIWNSEKEIKDLLQKYKTEHFGPRFDTFMEGTLESAPKILTERFDVKIDSLKSPVKEHFSNPKAIKKWLNNLYKQPEIAPLLELAKWSALGLPIKVKGSESAKLSICIGGRKESGVEKNVVHIAASVEEVKLSYFYGLIIRELTRFIAQEVFENSGNPYYLHNEDKKIQFEAIFKNVEGQQSNLDCLIQNVFTKGNYIPEQYHSELFVRVPQMIVNYQDFQNMDSGNGINRLERLSSTGTLLNYYRDHFISIIKAHTKFCLERASKI